MRHNVLVYLNYFYDEIIKDHDRLWRTKVVFWNFLNTIYEIFVFSETVVFLPEKHFGKNLVKIKILVTSYVMKSRHF